MRRVVAALGIGALATCASPAPPPGGPPDSAPPVLLGVSPDSGAVSVKPDEVLFRFDEVVSERPQGAADLRALFVISPRDGDPVVRWRRSAVGVRPRRGWRDNTVYTVTMLGGITDLRGNVDRESRRVVFSTGADFPQTIIAGRVFDWMANRPAIRAAVEAINVADSTTYVAVADSSGAFEMAAVRPGQYAVRGFIDANNNRRRDAREAWDSTMVELRDSVRMELLAAVHDTIGPRIATVVVRDTITLRITFDQPLSPDDSISADRVSLTRADSTRVPIAVVASVAAFERIETEARRRRADSIRLADTTRAPAQPPARDTTVRDTLVADTLQAPLRPSRPPPLTEMAVRLGAPLTPATVFRLRVENVQGLAGAPRTSERVFSTPRPAPRDTTSRRQPGDSLPGPQADPRKPPR